MLEHRVDAGFGVERTRGPAGGGAVAASLGGRWDVGLEVLGGSLTGSGAGVATRDIGAIGLTAGARVAPWLTVRSGVERRIYSTAVGRQRWVLVHAGAELRVSFLSGAIQAVGGGAWLPVVSVNGLPGPDVAFTASTGLEYDVGPALVSLRYALERCDFPPQLSGQRLEQLSGLTLGARVRLAGR